MTPLRYYAERATGVGTSSGSVIASSEFLLSQTQRGRNPVEEALHIDRWWSMIASVGTNPNVRASLAPRSHMAEYSCVLT